MRVCVIFKSRFTYTMIFDFVLTETMEALPGWLMGDDFLLTKNHTVKHYRKCVTKDEFVTPISCSVWKTNIFVLVLCAIMKSVEGFGLFV